MYEPIYGRKEKKRNIFLPALGLITVLTLLFIFVLKPSYLGYSIYKDVQNSNTDLETYTQNLQEISQNLESTKTNLTYQSAHSQELKNDLKQTSQELIDCKITQKTTAKELELLKKSHELELKTLQQQLDHQKSAYETKLQTKDDELKEKTQTIQEKCTTQQQDNKEELTELKQQVKDLETSLTQLTQNSAKNICCKQKFDNPQISSYTIIENKITCLTQGENKLNC